MPVVKLILIQLALVIGMLGECRSSRGRAAASAATESGPWVSYAVGDMGRDTTLFSSSQEVGVLNDPAVRELSGMAASCRNKGYFWIEQDSGNPNQIQLVSPKGAIVARITVDGAENRDWEDIAVGPGPVPNQTYIYLADIGDNQRWYSEKVIYRFPEPTIQGQKLPFTGRVTNAEAIRLQLPQGPQNAEAILIDPATKDLFIISKDDYSTVYRAAFPQSLTEAMVMTRQLMLPFRHVTSATMSTDGREILIRTYEDMFYFTRQVGESLVESLKCIPRLVPIASEPQGEAVGWAANGSGYYTTSEKVYDAPQAIYFYSRKKAGYAL